MIIMLSANKKYTLSRFQLYARSAASYLIGTWNTRWITSWTPPKTSREERSRLGRLKQEKTTGVLRNVLILSDSVRVPTFKEALIKNHTKGMKTSRAFRESTQRVTTVVSGRSVKCDAFFAVWIFAVVDLGYEQQTLTTLFCMLKYDFLDVKRFEF